LRAEIQSFDSYRLPLLNLANKHTLIFRDQEDDQQAAVKIDLQLTLQHTLNDVYYRVTLIEADLATSFLLEEKFRNAAYD